MLSSLTVYRHAIALRPHYFALLLLLSGIATLLEGSALVLLVPMIDLGTRGATGDSSLAVEIVLRLLAAVQVPLTVPGLLAAFTGVTVVSVVLTWLANSAMWGLIASAEAHMRRKLFEAVMEMDWPVLAREKTGHVIKALTGDPVQAGTGLMYLVMAATAGLSSLVYMAVASLLSWQLTLLSAGFGLALLPLYLRQIRRGKAASTEASHIEEQMTTHGAETIGNAKLLFSQGLRGRVAGDFGQLVARHRRARFWRDVKVESSRLVFEFFAVLFAVGVLFLVVWTDRWPISSGLIFLALFYRLAPKVANFQGYLFRASNYGTWVESWLDRLHAYQQARAQPGGAGVPRFESRLELSSVSYRYPSKDMPAVREVSLTLAQGECIALTGPSGHGKSTIIDLITGLLMPQEGEVRLDGRPLAELDLAQWQQRIGLVPQDPPLLHATVRQNIMFYEDGEADAAWLEECARTADALDFIKALPQGFDTLVGERGAQLSGGQRQRIALARALYRRPSLLILDEATSALDGATAGRVVTNLAVVKDRMAMIVVSHARQLLALADREYAVTEGRVTCLPQPQVRQA